MKRKNKWDKWFLLSWRRLWIIVVGAFVSIMLHNLIYGLFQSYFDARGGDEPVFFIITFVLIFYLIISAIYSLINKLKQKA